MLICKEIQYTNEGDLSLHYQQKPYSEWKVSTIIPHIKNTTCLSLFIIGYNISMEKWLTKNHRGLKCLVYLSVSSYSIFVCIGSAIIMYWPWFTLTPLSQAIAFWIHGPRLFPLSRLCWKYVAGAGRQILIQLDRATQAVLPFPYFVLSLLASNCSFIFCTHECGEQSSPSLHIKVNYHLL